MTLPSKPVPAFGFLTVVEQVDIGLVGGYLLLNAAGRPLEFHCTAPVKATRTQEILYGRTLRPYLCCDQIGQALLAKSKADVQLVCVDDASLVELRSFTAAPVALLLAEQNAVPSDGVEFALGSFNMWMPSSQAAGRDTIVRRYESLTAGLDLLEPFDRIREALAEAHKAVKAA
jgi:hypothetical protein